MILSDLIRERIKITREQKGVSPVDMAMSLHMDERNYKRIESGERKNLDIELLEKIATLLGVDFVEFISNKKTVIINTINKNGQINKGNRAEQSIIEHYKQVITEQERIIEAKNKLIDDLLNLLKEENKSR